MLELDLGALILSARAARVSLGGPSGSGKTALLRAVAGLDPVRGYVRACGEVWLDSAAGVNVPTHFRRVGWVPQESALFPHLDVAGNLGYAGATRPEIAAIASLLEIAPLLDRRPRHLSGGERQRVAIGRALLAKPKLLLLDEPFASLDTALRDRLAPRLKAWCAERDMAWLLVTHDAWEAEELCDESWRLESGTLRRLDREIRSAALSAGGN